MNITKNDQNEKTIETRGNKIIKSRKDEKIEVKKR